LSLPPGQAWLKLKETWFFPSILCFFCASQTCINTFLLL
jgi:hypothetical protein